LNTKNPFKKILGRTNTYLLFHLSPNPTAMTKKIFKWTGLVLLAIVLSLLVTVQFLHTKKFNAPYPNIAASTDSAVIARGKYLVYGAAHCADCHSPEGTEKSVDAGKEVPLSGGRVFSIPPGDLYTPNLTPDASGIGKLQDKEIARSLRYGIRHDGTVLFDFMPFHNTSVEDLRAIISYLRSAQPVKNEVPKNEYSLLGKFLLSFVIKPVGPSMEIPAAIQPDSSIEYGKYLAYSVANCRGCHTDRDLKTGAFIGQEFAGGFELESQVDKNYLFYSPNITPHPKNGKMFGWTEEQFIDRFRKGKVYPQSPMPWGPFSRLDEKELKALYRYLQTVAPMEREVPNTYITKEQ
jgi:mono/diheme cytochrome c family protein